VILVFLFNSCKKDNASENPIPENPLPEEQDSGILFSSNKNGHNELYKLQDDEETLLLSDASYDYWWPKVSPDKSKFLVYRSPTNPAKNHDDYQEAELLIFDMNGKNEQVLIEKGKHGWSGQGVGRWNKDGSKILMIAEQTVAEGKQWRMKYNQTNHQLYKRSRSLFFAQWKTNRFFCGKYRIYKCRHHFI